MGRHQKRKQRKSDTKLSKRQKDDFQRFGEQHPLDTSLGSTSNSTNFVSEEVYEDLNAEMSESDQKSESSDEEPDSYTLLLNSLGKNNCKAEHSESESEENEDTEACSEFPIIGGQVEDFVEDSGTENSESEETELDINVDAFSVHLDAKIDGDLINTSDYTIKENKHFSQLGNVDIVSTKSSQYKFRLIKATTELKMNSKISENLSKSILINTSGQSRDLSEFQLQLLSVCESYKDFLFNERTFENGEDIRFVYSMHALNHVLKTRTRIIHHNSKIKNNEAAEYRDQGFVRPKVLIVVPFRESCLRIMKILISLLFGDSSDENGAKINVMNGKRFMEEFASDDQRITFRKPDDYKQLFAGNIDDSFRIGISVTKKSLKLYSDFYSSDIIIASPLGLRIIIGADGDKQRDYDFLASIEMLIIDQADVLLMQNWEHIILLMKHMNLQPKEAHGVDFSRVRMWALEGLSKYYRQTLVFSSVNCVTVNALFNKEAQNYEGKIIVRNPVMEGSDIIRRILVQCPQLFHRFDCNSIKSATEERFKYFTNKIIPEFKDSLKSHTLVYIPSYFDYVRLRNYFRKEELNFTQICEYTKEGKVAQSRSFFFHGGRHFLLYTERAHFFNRYHIKGIRHLIFYELPTYPHFYSEMCNLLHPSNQGKKFTGDESSLSCITLYNKYDFPNLCAIVGNERAKILMQSRTDTHLFVTENHKT
ncbi:Digestive organ expansion factor-like protein [Leptotrombidium deliense]|uniref:U3 small nucleolar RNA-associated protein 25 homolog n=1 Tax=Leptotrombidium deliense TaxID=299467 RepID=A0A443SGN7_9ACAR|nr:Digestive organ expansion factor-like protein [Leptotrombidium deliense]